MKYKQLFELESNQEFDAEFWSNLVNFINKWPEVKLNQGESEIFLRQKARELIIKNGVSSVFLTNLNEALLPKTEQENKHLLVKVIVDQLTSLSPSNDLIVVDPYFFAKFPKNSNHSDYIDTVKDIFRLLVDKIARIRFITNKNIDASLQRDIIKMIKDFKKGLIVECIISEDIHDRFWIVDESKGLFIGTSLNGVGKKYAISDYLKKEDTEEILKALRELHLIV